MAKLTIEDISRILTDKNGLSREAAATFAREMFSVVQDAVERDKLVKVKGLGAFKVVDVEARESINVNTGARVLIEGHGKISFTPDTTMKELVNKPFSQFETVVLNDGVTFDDIATPDELEEDEREEEKPAPMGNPKVVEETPKVTEEAPIVETTPVVEEVPIVEETPVVEEVPIEENPIVEEKETTIAEEKAPVKEDNPIVEEKETTIAEEKVSVEEKETPIEEKDSPIEEASPNENEDEDDEEEDSNSDAAKWIVAAVISLVLIVLAACGGYIYGLSKGRAEARELAEATEEQKPQAPQSKDSLLAALHPEEPVVLDTTSKQPAKDTAKTAQKGVPTKATPKPEPKQNPKPEAKTTQKPEPSTKYEQMDARVRTGAYRIVGVDRTVTVKKGETLKRISKTYLGEGMECYVEVLNGLSGNGELKEGSKLKIPKLELKKRGK